MNSGKIVAGGRDGWTDRGSIRGPRGPKKSASILQQISPVGPTEDNKEGLPFPFPSMPSGILQQISHLLSCKLEI